MAAGAGRAVALGEHEDDGVWEALVSCPIPRTELHLLLQELSQQSRTINELIALPLTTVEALSNGESDTFPLELLVSWLQDLQQRTQKNVQLSELVELLCTDLVPEHAPAASGQQQEATDVSGELFEEQRPSPLCIVALRGSCSWGHWLSAAGGHWWELSTRPDPAPPTDYERWEVHRVDRDVYAFKNVGQHNWLAAESNGIVRVNRDKRDTWEAWQLHTREPWGEGQCNIALRSHHGRFLCQEPPGFPTWNPAYWGGAAHRYCNNILNVIADKPHAREWETFTLTDGDGKSLPGWMWDKIKKHALVV